MTVAPIHFVVPGRIDQRTGGYLYDARMVGEMRRAGRNVTVHELAGSFPVADEVGRNSLARTLADIPDDGITVVDGLAGGGLPEVLASAGHRLRIVGLVHHPLAEETGIAAATAERLTRTERAALAVCRGVIVTSRFTAGRLGRYGVGERRVHVVPPGTDPAPEAPGPPPGAPPRLLCVASITKRKGHPVLLEALARIADLPWSCAFAGSETLDPEHAQAVRQATQYAGLDQRVSFLGELDAAALDEAYAASTLFVLASHYEGYGMALTEAIARGIPVVSTTGGAIPYTVPAGAGALVAPGDVDALAGALRKLLSDGGVTLSTLRAGALRARGELLDWEEAGRRFLGAVESAAQGVGPDAVAGDTAP